MSVAESLIRTYYARTGQPRDSELDAAFAYQRALLRDMMGRLEVILQDEDVPQEVVVRVLRCLLYGAPSPADAELRIEQDARLAEALSRIPPMPVNVHMSGSVDPKGLSAAISQSIRRQGLR